MLGSHIGWPDHPSGIKWWVWEVMLIWPTFHSRPIFPVHVWAMAYPRFHSGSANFPIFFRST